MWKSKLQSVEIDPQNNSFALLHFLFEHTDERTEAVMDRFSDPREYLVYARNYLKKLELADALALFVATPPIGEIDLSVPPPKVETAKEREEREYEESRRDLIQAKQDLEMKLITQAEFDAKAQTVKDVKPVVVVK